MYTLDMLYIYINQNPLNHVHQAAQQISDKIYLFAIQYSILPKYFQKLLNKFNENKPLDFQIDSWFTSLVINLQKKHYHYIAFFTT